ncbi:hypothetical protein H257_18967 [Aphanomyces astaci]|uniref:Uncharacterized protein n=1 Tax=Aphanomyces astaci TaxID=112090 RepID=W4F9E4_APHAT|nr:hypothetical protein H257_18967 [Aphanomyces astaci]ETV64095.1 hypothetical protein H257_18967 [Aphanomyces astaci]|eukprot:XP_009846420.1 hypothetical protein H257_18967 [Aphanomyces astaci]
MKDLGEVSDILGWQVERNRAAKTIFLHQSLLPCRWVFRIKPNGTYKARLVIKAPAYPPIPRILQPGRKPCAVPTATNGVPPPKTNFSPFTTTRPTILFHA